MQCVWVLLIFLPAALSQKFKVEGPDVVAGVSGSDVVLPCSVRELDRPNIMMNAKDLSVTWSRSDLRDSKVHLYENHKDLNTDQNPSYRGRTAVFKEELNNGNVSLILSNIRFSDQGVYTCRVDSRFWEDHRSVTLSIEVIGSEPEITVEKYESGKFSLLCESKGWYPEPVLQWRNSKGVNLTAETETPEFKGFWFNIKSRITVEETDSFSCTVSRRNQVVEGQIDAQTLEEYLPNPGRTAGIIFGVLLLLGLVAGAGVFLYIKIKKRQEELKGIEEERRRLQEENEKLIEKERRREEEIEKVTSLLISGRDACLQHHNLSDCQWDHVVKTLLKSGGDERLLHQNLSNRQSDHPEETLLKPEEEQREFNLRKFNLRKFNLRKFNLRKYDPSDRGVEKLQRVIAASKHVQLKQCNLTEESCKILASVLSSENSLIELDLSLNNLDDAGVKELCEGLKNNNCKLQKLRLEFCNLTEKSCEDLSKVLQSQNSLIELTLNRNEIQDSGVKKLCGVDYSRNFTLQILSLEYCDLTERSCEYLAEVLQSDNSKLIELNLNKNKLQDTGVEKLCVGLKNTKYRLLKLRLANCSITDTGCTALTEALLQQQQTLQRQRQTLPLIPPSSLPLNLDLRYNQISGQKLSDLQETFHLLKVTLD